jgi:hypothetical protein
MITEDVTKLTALQLFVALYAYEKILRDEIDRRIRQGDPEVMEILRTMVPEIGQGGPEALEILRTMDPETT